MCVYRLYFYLHAIKMKYFHVALSNTVFVTHDLHD